MFGCEYMQTKLPIHNMFHVKKVKGRIVSVHKGKQFIYCVSDNVLCCVYVGWEYRDRIEDGCVVWFFMNDDGFYEYLPD